VKTTGNPVALEAFADRNTLTADGADLAFITVQVTDAEGLTVPDAGNLIRFSVEGPGELVATDNGDPTDMIPFPLHQRNAFNGLALAIVRSKPGEKGNITVHAVSGGIKGATVIITCE